MTIEALCGAADRTRGSFYHHFVDHGAFIAALMDAWRLLYTDEIIERAQRSGDPEATSARLNSLASALDHRTEARIRQLALANDRARMVLGEVDRKRIDFLASLYGARASIDEKTAFKLAQIEYAAFVGAQMLWPDEEPGALAALGEFFARLAADNAFRRINPAN